MGGIIKKLISLIIAMVVCGALTVGATGEKNGTELWCTGEDFGAAVKVGEATYLSSSEVRERQAYHTCGSCGYATWFEQGEHYTSYSGLWCGAMRLSNLEFDKSFSGFCVGSSGVTVARYQSYTYPEVAIAGNINCNNCGVSFSPYSYYYTHTTLTDSYPVYRFVPEFTPTAIKLKNCRFSPHDGINSQRKEVV